MKPKKYNNYTLFLVLVFSVILVGCSDTLEDLDGAALIRKHKLVGTYKVQITPKMMGIAAVTTGEHNAEISDEGNGVLRLKFSGFQKKPMPFEMSINMLMRVKPGPNGALRIENMGGDFDADLPEGETVIDPNDVPEGIEVPEDALVNGLHSNGASSISGDYKMMKDLDGKGASMNFDLNLEPNVGLPVVVSIRTNKKIK